jgi:hypothetical protein
MKKYLISAFNSSDGDHRDESVGIFHCLFEIDYDEEQFNNSFQEHYIKKVVVGNDNLQFRERGDYISWSWIGTAGEWRKKAYFMPNIKGFEINDFEDDDSAILYFKLKQYE